MFATKDPGWVSVSKAAAVAGVTRRAIYQRAMRGRIELRRGRVRLADVVGFKTASVDRGLVQLGATVEAALEQATGQEKEILTKQLGAELLAINFEAAARLQARAAAALTAAHERPEEGAPSKGGGFDVVVRRSP